VTMSVGNLRREINLAFIVTLPKSKNPVRQRIAGMSGR
jgi:hypothetical protein